MIYAAYKLIELGAKNVLIKGGHLKDKNVIDVLINAAGITIPNVSENSETTIKNFDKTIAINLKASFLLIEGLKNNFNTKINNFFIGCETKIIKHGKWYQSCP